MEQIEKATDTLPKIEKVNNRREYMRKYMKERYDKDGEKARGYCKALKIKAKHNLPKEDFSMYGVYLSEVYKIRELFKKLPTDIQAKCLTEIHA